ncbi:MAG: response regulator transcription factor [Vicingaceae bacterium]|nr:response regulator transcription factor [Vicingaceae bacterium]
MEKEIKILLVDDHKIIRDGIKLMLNKNPEIKIISEAENGIEAIDFMNKNANEIDVILMDISMPLLDGISATRAIKKSNKKVNILILTMHLEQAYFDTIFEAGALGYILKESGRDEIVHAIKTVADNKKYVGEDVGLIIQPKKRRF